SGEAKTFAQKLRNAAGSLNGSLLVTLSRRTDAEAARALSTALHDRPHYVWDGNGDNPYFGLLGLADFIVVTCDSVNMISEAASTGKPVYIEMLPGGSVHSARFLECLRETGITRDFHGTLAPYSYMPLNDRARAAERVGQLLPTL